MGILPTSEYVHPSDLSIQPSDCYFDLDDYMMIAPTLFLTAKHYHLVSVILVPPLLSVSSNIFYQPCLEKMTTEAGIGQGTELGSQIFV